MKPLTLTCAALAASLALLLPAAPAQAVNGTSFLSSTGSGTACTFAAPCLSPQAAHDATVNGGQISCFDTGNFSSVIISKTITIDCAGTTSTTGGLTINPPGIVVTIRNLTIT